MEKAVAHKNMHNEWECRTRVMLGTRYQLEVLTARRWGGQLVTTANVGVVEGGFVSMRMFHDFSQRMATATHSRVTAKVVEAQHEECVSKLEELKEAVTAFYQAKNEPITA